MGSTAESAAISASESSPVDSAPLPASSRPLSPTVSPPSLLPRLSGPLDALMARGVAYRERGNLIALNLRPEEAAQGGIASISMPVDIRCPDCTRRVRPAGCARCAGRRALPRPARRLAHHPPPGHRRRHPGRLGRAAARRHRRGALPRAHRSARLSRQCHDGRVMRNEAIRPGTAAGRLLGLAMCGSAPGALDGGLPRAPHRRSRRRAPAHHLCPPGWIGRGAREHPAAMQAALADDPAVAIEMDVHRSRDGHLVVIHDATVDRTTNGGGAVDGADPGRTAGARRRLLRHPRARSRHGAARSAGRPARPSASRCAVAVTASPRWPRCCARPARADPDRHRGQGGRLRGGAGARAAPVRPPEAACWWAR